MKQSVDIPDIESEHIPERIVIDKDGRVVLRFHWKRLLKVLIILSLAIGSYFLPLPGLTLGSRLCLMIFVGAAGLWITEAIPPFATAIMAIVMSIYLLGRPGGPLNLEGGGLANSYQIFLNPIVLQYSSYPSKTSGLT